MGSQFGPSHSPLRSATQILVEPSQIELSHFEEYDSCTILTQDDLKKLWEAFDIPDSVVLELPVKQKRRKTREKGNLFTSLSESVFFFFKRKHSCHFISACITSYVSHYISHNLRMIFFYPNSIPLTE